MEINVELEKLKNEVLRKIGRNVMLFQQMEHLLKFLVANGTSSGYASELKTNHEQRTATIHKKTMGQVVGEFLENTFSPSEETTNEPKEETWFSFLSSIECDDLFYEERRKTLESLTAERNYLVHHLLSKWDFKSFESTKEIEPYLDQLREKIVPEIEFLQSQVKAMQEAWKEHKDFLDSDEGGKMFKLAPLRASLHVAGLFEFAEQRARLDGWAVVSSARNFIRQIAPENLLTDDIANIKNRYGFKTLEEILFATEWFDFREEPTDKGGIRLLYRIKPDLNFVD